MFPAALPPYLSAKGPLFMSKEVQSVLPLGQPRDVNVIQPLQCSSTVRFVRFQHLYNHAESEKITHSVFTLKQFRSVCLGFPNRKFFRRLLEKKTGNGYPHKKTIIKITSFQSITINTLMIGTWHLFSKSTYTLPIHDTEPHNYCLTL